MKSCIAFLMVTLFITPNLWASLECPQGKGKVTLSDEYAMEISNLHLKGIANGSYSCLVTRAELGFLANQKAMECQKDGEQRTIVMAWMVEGLDMFGRPAASIALYNQDRKVFEAACGKE